MDITLNWYEYSMAAEVGLRRSLESKRAGLEDAHGLVTLGWSESIEGAIGELVVAKALNIYWDGSVNTFKAPDFPPNIQVRTRPHPEHDLIVRPVDDLFDIFVLVTGKCPSYTVRGFIHGYDARDPEWLHNEGIGFRPDAYFVPQWALKPIEGLKEVALAISDSYNKET